MSRGKITPVIFVWNHKEPKEKECLWTDLSEEEKAVIGEKLMDTYMEKLGYDRI